MLDRDAVVVCDGGDFVSYAGKYIDSYEPGCWLDPGPYGCLGTGLGYAMAARIARPDKQVVLMLGDGAAGFSLMDVDTLVRHQLPVVIVCGNNGIWGLEKHPMKMLYGYDVAADLQPGCRYDDVVKALGGAGETVTDPGEIRGALDRALRARTCRTSSTSSPIPTTCTRGRATWAERATERVFSRKRSMSTITRLTRPTATRPRSSLTDTVKVTRRPLTFSTVASAVTVWPDGGGREMVELHPHADRGLAGARARRAVPCTLLPRTAR